MFNVYLCLELDNGKRMFIELGRGVSPSSTNSLISSTNELKYEGKEKVLDAYIVKAKAEEFENILSVEKKLKLKG